MGYKRFERPASETADLTCNATYTGAVGTIGGQVDFNNGIAQAKSIDHGETSIQLAVKFEQTCMVIAESKFPCRAEHARGSDAPDF